ncbi:TPA: hypothetical protein ACHU2M_001694 [Shigella sonnei]
MEQNTPSNFDVAKMQMRRLIDSEGHHLSIRPTVLLVPPEPNAPQHRQDDCALDAAQLAICSSLGVEASDNAKELGEI